MWIVPNGSRGIDVHKVRGNRALLFLARGMIVIWLAELVLEGCLVWVKLC